MNNIEQRAEATFDEIRSKFSDISIGDENAKSTIDPTKARFFNFDYVKDGKNFGNVTISIIDGDSFKVYFDKDIDNGMSDAEKKSWYKFLRQLKFFAMQNRFVSFDIRDIAKSGLNLRDLKHANRDAETVTSDEVDLNESKMYGTSRSSYQKLENVRIIARHSKPIVDETKPGARSRNIECFYVENSLGERFRLPEGTTLNGARAYARHVKNGGAIHDEFGQHIGKIINEMHTLKHFVRNMRGRQFEDVETQVMVESAIDHYGKLHRDLYTCRSQRGYEQYRALWTPEVLDEDDFDIDALKERFVRRVFDDKLLDALPIVHRAYKTRSEQVGEEFAAWADSLGEDSLMGMADPVVTIYDKDTGDLLDKLNLSVAAKKYQLDVNTVKSQLQHQDRTDIGGYTIAAPIAGQPVDDTTQGAVEEDSSPLSKVSNPEPYTTQHPDFNKPETVDEKLNNLLDKWGFEYQLIDGVYYFESREEVDRAENVVLSKGMTVPEMGVKDPTGVYGATTNDRDLSRMSSAVHEDQVDMSTLKLLAGLTK